MPGKPGPKITCNCHQCGASFEVQPATARRGGGKYCSPECKQRHERNREQIACKFCGKSFESQRSNRRVYCSTACYWAAITLPSGDKPEQSIDRRIIGACAQCGKEMTYSPSAKRRFCSLECRNASYVGRQRINHVLSKTCPQCGKVFKQRALSRIRTYCSSKCQYEYAQKRISVICPTCEHPFETKESDLSRGRGRYCSLACYRKGRPRTHIEEVIASVLGEWNVSFVEQHTIGRFTCDFFLPESNLIIETDGDYWHSLSGVTIKDKRRDKHLQHLGFTILRLTETDVCHNLEWCKIEITTALRE